MAQKPDGKAAKTERVTFTRPAAERIAKVVRAFEAGDRSQSPLSFGSHHASAEPRRVVVPVRNDTGQAVPRLGVMAIGSPETYEEDGELFIKFFIGTIPAGGSQPVGVAMHPIAQGEVGKLAIAGSFPCKVKVLPGNHGYARGRANDVTQLISAECGPIRLLWAAGEGNAQSGAAMA